MFKIDNDCKIFSPQLVYFEEIIDANIQNAVEQSGDPKRLWPHVKTHKTAQIVRKLINKGVTKFKCATLSECEMVAGCGAEALLLAYPVVGPNIERFIRLMQTFPKVRCYALFDDFNELEKLNEQASSLGITAEIFLDVNVGLDRTGVPMDKVVSFVEQAQALTCVKIAGLHCYDGHNGIGDRALREKTIVALIAKEEELRAQVEKVTGSKPMVIAGGTPEFPCYKEHSDFFLSPGTLFLNDHGYGTAYRDLDYPCAAAVLTRVISHPRDGYFTLDCGYKAIAADPKQERGVIAGWEGKVEDLFQNEEHWVFKMKEGCEDERPAVGTVLYVIPTHICPTSALYPYALVIRDGKITDRWEIAARNRKITI